MSAGSFAIMVHSLASPEEVEAFLKETLGKRIEALEAALREIANRDSKTLHPGEAIAIAAQALK